MPGYSDYVLYIIKNESEGLVDIAQNIGVKSAFYAAVFVPLLQTPTSRSVLKTLLSLKEIQL